MAKRIDDAERLALCLIMECWGGGGDAGDGGGGGGVICLWCRLRWRLKLIQHSLRLDKLFFHNISMTFP